MKIKFNRVLYDENGRYQIPKGFPWNAAEIVFVKDNYYLSFLIKRNLLFTPFFKNLYRKAKYKLDNHTKDII